MTTQMQLEVILAGNRIATLSCEAKTTNESIKTKTESRNCFCIHVVLSIKLRLIVSCPQIWNKEKEKDREKENVGDRTVKVNEKKTDRQPEREIKRKETFFVRRTT